jgi:Domain of unknown function (DUF5642)
VTSVTVLLAAGCDGSGAVEPSPAPVADQGQAESFEAARVKRVHGDLPAGYEVGDAPGPASPVLRWGMGAQWRADPAPCGALIDPVPGAQGEGLSGSGDGGLLYVVAAPAPPGEPVLDPALLAECGRWSVVAGRSTALVATLPGPDIDGAATVGMTADVRTVVESGTETDSRTDTFVAYLDGGVVFVTLTVDPGSPHPPLPAQDAAELLRTAVAVVRGQRAG